MSLAVRHIPYKNRLARLVQAPGGTRVADALAAAQANLEELTDICLAEIDRAIAAVQQAADSPDKTAESFGQVYAASNEMTGLAGLFGREDLGKAAHSLCELLDRTGSWERCSPVALKVHIDSLGLLRHPAALTEAELKAILGGLEKVVDRTVRTPT